MKQLTESSSQTYAKNQDGKEFQKSFRQSTHKINSHGRIGDILAYTRVNKNIQMDVTLGFQ